MPARGCSSNSPQQPSVYGYLEVEWTG
jgi:hypothetical protein